MRKNKRAGSEGLGTVKALILVLLVIGVSAWLFGKYIKKGDESFANQIVLIDLTTCKTQTLKEKAIGMNPRDLDKDDLKDIGDCDVCLGGDIKDTDSDGIPNACDNSPEKSSKSPKEECSKVGGKWSSSDQCTLPHYCTLRKMKFDKEKGCIPI